MGHHFAAQAAQSRAHVADRFFGHASTTQDAASATPQQPASEPNPFVKHFDPTAPSWTPTRADESIRAKAGLRNASSRVRDRFAADTQAIPQAQRSGSDDPANNPDFRVTSRNAFRDKLFGQPASTEPQVTATAEQVPHAPRGPRPDPSQGAVSPMPVSVPDPDETLRDLFAAKERGFGGVPDCIA